jgi:hypothetical protein
MKKNRLSEAGKPRQEPKVIAPGLRAILDHVAEELAREYIELVKGAAEQKEQ